MSSISEGGLAEGGLTEGGLAEDVQVDNSSISSSDVVVAAAPAGGMSLGRVSGRAVMVGINYTNQEDYSLDGCIASAYDFQRCIESEGFNGETRTLCDDGSVSSMPLRRSIHSSLDWLLSTPPGGTMILYFAGRIGNDPTTTSSALLPADHLTEGTISLSTIMDEVLHSIPLSSNFLIVVDNSFQGGNFQVKTSQLVSSYTVNHEGEEEESTPPNMGVTSPSSQHDRTERGEVALLTANMSGAGQNGSSVFSSAVCELIKEFASSNEEASPQEVHPSKATPLDRAHTEFINQVNHRFGSDTLTPFTNGGYTARDYALWVSKSLSDVQLECQGAGLPLIKAAPLQNLAKEVFDHGDAALLISQDLYYSGSSLLPSYRKFVLQLAKKMKDVATPVLLFSRAFLRSTLDYDMFITGQRSSPILSASPIGGPGADIGGFDYLTTIPNDPVGPPILSKEDKIKQDLRELGVDPLYPNQRNMISTQGENRGGGGGGGGYRSRSVSPLFDEQRETNVGINLTVQSPQSVQTSYRPAPYLPYAQKEQIAYSEPYSGEWDTSQWFAPHQQHQQQQLQQQQQQQQYHQQQHQQHQQHQHQHQQVAPPPSKLNQVIGTRSDLHRMINKIEAALETRDNPTTSTPALPPQPIARPSQNPDWDGSGADSAMTFAPGFISAGGDILCSPRYMTLSEAKRLCLETPQCLGFSYEGIIKNPSTPVWVYFKDKLDVHSGKWCTFMKAGAASRKQSPVRSSSPPTSGLFATKYRLIKFYNHYNPAKLPSVTLIMQQYAGREAELFKKLTSSYGPEPEGEDPPLPLGWTQVQSPFGDVFYKHHDGRKQWHLPRE